MLFLSSGLLPGLQATHTACPPPAACRRLWLPGTPEVVTWAQPEEQWGSLRWAGDPCGEQGLGRKGLALAEGPGWTAGLDPGWGAGAPMRLGGPRAAGTLKADSGLVGTARKSHFPSSPL